MEYMLLIHTPPSLENATEEQREALAAEFGQFHRDLREAGAHVGSDRLQPGHTATLVSEHDGEIVTTDGPFAETKEVLGGYFKIEVDTIDEAIEWASRIPSVKAGGKVEVRPVMPVPADLPAGS